MQRPLELTFRDMEPSTAVEAAVREKAEQLEQYSPYIVGCHVMIERPHRHHHRGNLFSIRIRITAPGDELVVDRQPDQEHAHEDIYVAIRDAFDSMRRQLEDYTRRRRRHVKTHPQQPIGLVARLFPDEGYGFIVDPEGKEVYFHRHSVLHDWYDMLKVGSAVQYNEEEGDKGPQAAAVRLVALPRAAAE